MSTRVVHATFRVVTPLFLGGAEPSKECELRTASIKGALLFWWRALHGPGRRRPDLWKQEQTLFGSSDGGQSRWLLDAREESLIHGGAGRLELDEGRGYLAGQGLARQPDRQPQQHYGRPRRPLAGGGGDHRPKPFESCRPYLPPGKRIHLRAFRRDRSPGGTEEAATIRDALIALATFGGLGSRSRRGFGSLHLEELSCAGGVDSWEKLEEPSSLEGWANRIAGLLDGISHSALPEFTHFSDDTRILLLRAPNTSTEELHEELGRRFKSFRSHERTGGIGQADHDDMVAWLGGRPLAAPPRRAVFGLPHNYYFSGSGNMAWVNPASQANRRASPLFMHLDEIGERDDRHALAILTFLPAAFLPPGQDQIQVKGRIKGVQGRGPEVRLRPRADRELWQPIHDWLDELEHQPPCNATTWTKP